MSEYTKTCRSCGDAKALDAFSRHPQTRDGRASSCKACDSKRLRARAEKIKSTVKVVPESKVCPTCRTEKPSAEFGKRAALKDGLSYECKACTRKRSAEYLDANPEQREKNRLRCQAFYADQPRYLDSLYRAKFGISYSRYESMLKAQDGKCAICSREPVKQRLSVDHDHGCCPDKSKSCGECVRGLLFSDCNFGIGLFRDNADLLRRAVEYLSS